MDNERSLTLPGMLSMISWIKNLSDKSKMNKKNEIPWKYLWLLNEKQKKKTKVDISLLYILKWRNQAGILVFTYYIGLCYTGY